MERLLNLSIKASLVLVVFLIPLAWSPWTFESFEFPKQYLFFVLVALGLVAWFAKMVLVEREIHFRKTPLNLLVLLFVAVAVFSSVFSADPFSSLFGSFGRFGDGLFGILSGAGLYFLVLNTAEKPKFLVRPFLVSCALVVAIAYLALFGVVGEPGFNTVAASQATFSVFLAFLASFLAFLTLQKTRGLGLAALLALLFAVLGLLFQLGSFAHGVLLLFGLLLALLFGLLQLAWSREGVRQGGLWLLTALALGSFVALFSPGLVPGLARETREPMLSQATSWNIALATVKENGKNLLLGSGPGTFALDIAKHKPVALNQTTHWQVRFARPASHEAEVLATLGVLGFLSYLALVAWFFLVSLLVLKRSLNFAFVLGAAALLAGQLVHEQTVTLQVAFWLFVALGASSWNLPVAEFRFSTRRFPEVRGAAHAVLALVAVLVAISFFAAGRLVRADMSYQASLQTLRADSQDAMGQAKKAAQLNPWLAEYKLLLSRLHVRRALDELQKPDQERNQEQVSQDVQLAIAYGRGGKVQGEEIVGATQLSPNKVAVWQTLGNVYQAIKSASGALEWSVRSFERAIALEPANPQLHTELGKLYVEQKEFAKAREQMEKARELKPDLAEPRAQLALLAEQEGEPQKALAELTELALVFPEAPEVLFPLGRLLYNKGEVEQAIVRFEQVLNIAPNHLNALFALGVAYESEGRIEQAIGAFEKVLRLNPGSQEVQERLQRLRR